MHAPLSTKCLVGNFCKKIWNIKGAGLAENILSIYFSFKCHSETLGTMISCSCVREAKPQAPKEIKFAIVFVMRNSNGTVMKTDIMSFLSEGLILIHNQQQIIQVFYWLFNRQGDKPENHWIMVWIAVTTEFLISEGFGLS